MVIDPETIGTKDGQSRGRNQIQVVDVIGSLNPCASRVTYGDGAEGERYANALKSCDAFLLRLALYVGSVNELSLFQQGIQLRMGTINMVGNPNLGHNIQIEVCTCHLNQRGCAPPGCQMRQMRQMASLETQMSQPSRWNPCPCLRKAFDYRRASQLCHMTTYYPWSLSVSKASFEDIPQGEFLRQHQLALQCSNVLPSCMTS